MVDIRLHQAIPLFAWGFLAFRRTTSMPAPTWDLLVHAFAANVPSPTDYRDTPLDPGTYYYRFSGFSETGLWRHAATERVAVVT